MPISKKVQEAMTFVASLRDGDRVLVVQDGKCLEMTVRGEPRRDDEPYGAPESIQVTVTLGPGRYSREITARGLAAGYYSAHRAL